MELSNKSYDNLRTIQEIYLKTRNKHLEQLILGAFLNGNNHKQIFESMLKQFQVKPST